MWRTVYLGYSEEMIHALRNNSDYSLEHVVGVKGRLSEGYYSAISEYSLPFTEITSKQELLDNAEILNDADIVIMHKFEFIIPQNLLSEHRFFNLHGGDLRTNRGAHAPVWSILLQEEKTCLSCYELLRTVGGGIDEGILIDTYPVEISKTDNPAALNAKLSEGIPMLLASMNEYLLGKRKGVLTEGGTYRRKIEKQDFTISLQTDSFDTIRAKVLSQQSYFGAVVLHDGRELRAKNYELSEDTGRTIVFADDKVIISEGKARMTLYF